MIANPILRKELLTILRSRKAVAMQALFLAATAILLASLWPGGGLQDVEGNQARVILGVLALGQLAMVALFAPAFSAAAITSEKEQNTFESLYATALRPSQIALGKIAGAMGFPLLVVVSGLPATASTLLLGGVGVGQVLAVLGLLLLTGAYLGMIGLLLSAFFRRSYRAIIATYAVILFVCFLCALPAWPLSGYLIRRGGTGWQSALHVLASLSPFQAMLSAVWPDSPYVRYAVGEPALPAFWKLYVPLSLGATLGTGLVCLLRLRTPVAPPRPREKLQLVERGRITARSFFFVIDPRKRKRMIGWWQNPILVKEFRTRPMLQGQWLLRAVASCLVVSILLVFGMAAGMQTLAGQVAGLRPAMCAALAALITVLILLVGPAMTAGAISADRETGVWELLRTTRLPSWRIVSGKFQASVLPLVMLVAAMLPALALLAVKWDFSAWPPQLNEDAGNVLRVLQVVGVTVLFVSCLGMFFSSVFPRTSTATAWTYGVVVCVGLLSLLMLLGQDRFSPRLMSAVFSVNPVAAAMAAAGNPTLQKLELVGPFLRILGGSTAILFVLTVARVFQLRRAE